MHYYITEVSNEFNGVHNINWSAGVLECWISLRMDPFQYPITTSSNPHKITKKRKSYSNEG